MKKLIVLLASTVLMVYGSEEVVNSESDSEGIETIEIIGSEDENVDPLAWAIENDKSKIVAEQIPQMDFWAKEDMLLKAAKCGSLEVAKLLIEAGAHADKAIWYTFTPLHFAVEYNWPKLVNYFIEQKADINVKDLYDKTPLYRAVEKNNLEMVKLLIAAGADTNNGIPLEEAVKGDYVDIVGCLIQAGASLDAKDFVGVAIDKQSNGLLCRLVAAGAKVGKYFNILMMQLFFSLELDNLLILAGMPYQPRTEFDKIACQDGTLFLPSHAIVNFNRSLPESYNYNNPDMPLGATRLMYAASQRMLANVKLLLDKGANPLLQDKYGRTVFDIVKIIVTNKDDLKLTNDTQVYTKILDACYKRVAKLLWCLHSTGSDKIKPEITTQFTRLPRDILFIIMMFVTSGMRKPV